MTLSGGVTDTALDAEFETLRAKADASPAFGVVYKARSIKSTTITSATALDERRVRFQEQDAWEIVGLSAQSDGDPVTIAITDADDNVLASTTDGLSGTTRQAPTTPVYLVPGNVYYLRIETDDPGPHEASGQVVLEGRRRTR